MHNSYSTFRSQKFAHWSRKQAHVGDLFLRTSSTLPPISVGSSTMEDVGATTIDSLFSRTAKSPAWSGPQSTLVCLLTVYLALPVW